MILSRRRAHFYSSIVLCCALPLVFLAGIIWRPRYEANSNADTLFDQAGFATSAEETGTLIDSYVDKAAGFEIQTISVTAGADSTAQIYLKLWPTYVLQHPELLVYWQPGQTSFTTDLNDGALLLGSLVGDSSRLFPLSQKTYGKEGELLLYNPISKQAVVTLSLPAEMTQQP